MIISRIIIPSSNFYVPRPSTNDLPKCKELIICAIQTFLIPIIILNQSLVTGVTRPTSSSHAYRTKIQAMFVMQLKHFKKINNKKNEETCSKSYLAFKKNIWCWQNLCHLHHFNGRVIRGHATSICLRKSDRLGPIYRYGIAMFHSDIHSYMAWIRAHFTRLNMV